MHVLKSCAALGMMLCLGHEAAAADACDTAGLKLPSGFCATVFADDLGHARHLAVSPDGTVYVNTWSGSYYDDAKLPERGFLVALRDTAGSGRADRTERFGATPHGGGTGGTGIAVYNGRLYAEEHDRIVRYDLGAGALAPKGTPVTVVSGLPLTGDHPMHPFFIDSHGAMYVDVASASNACQVLERKAGSPGKEPCVELETRGGIWRYDANREQQKFSKAERFATGIRNAEGIAGDAQGHLFATQHGRDQLYSFWPRFYQPQDEATLPAEELLLLSQGADFGWPYCYFDPRQQRLVLAPEYGGDGGKRLGPCASKRAPIATYPAHWAPNGMVFYDHAQFPARYRNGLFIAFHGSWNRAPFPQDGYNVVFQALDGDRAAGRCEIFADGFAGPVKTPEKASHRPSGLAVGPDGALYVSDDVRGRIYRISYQGGAQGNDTSVVPCPSTTAGAGNINAGAGKASSLPIAPGANADMVALGDRIYHGQVGGAACTGCHGANGGGTTLGPDLTDRTWLWSDGSLDGIQRTIVAGVAKPKKFRSPMPAKGGATLSDEQTRAVAAYVWGLSHRQ